MAKSLFIVFEGLDGSGKGEMIKRLCGYLSAISANLNIRVTAEPSSGVYGKKIREILQKDRNPKSRGAELLDLYVKDRKEHVEKEITPFLKAESGNKATVIICDRYYYSTIAYQGLQGIPIKELLEKNNDFPKPDIAFILDVPAEVALQRISRARPKTEKFEEIKFLAGLRNAFLSLQGKVQDNLKIIDADREPEKVFEDIKKEVDALLK
ncbi:dTMP kinase [Candidatus Woesearchaeota archaeon]|nr:dTMP kinase [Candidatus Woesearchaeota archaeon]